jgi:hypothetical protein
MSVCLVIDQSSKELGKHLQTPTLIGCMLLRILVQEATLQHLLVCFTTISEALDCITLFALSSDCFYKLSDENAPSNDGAFLL